MKQFDVPDFYRSPIIGKIKSLRRDSDPRKKDFTPTLLDFGPVRFLIARHFGFCYGVENAIEIIYRAIEDNPKKRIFLLSEMIHNPEVNADLLDRGVKFIMDTCGKQLIDWEDITADDFVIIPAFGTTIEIEKKIKSIGVSVGKYNTTCPFVERVWKMASKLSKEDYTIVIHGKAKHEETRATFSHAAENSPSVIVKDLKEAELLSAYIKGDKESSLFYKDFEGCYSEGFDPVKDLQKLGVVNQTTMLATETKEIAEFLKAEIINLREGQYLKDYFADTRDSLCYATNDNQNATYGLLEEHADIAVVVGGYNSSNTTHLVELCEQKCQTYFINNEKKILGKNELSSFNYKTKEEFTSDFLDDKEPKTIILTSGASCPDSTVDRVLQRILSFYDGVKSIEEVLSQLN
jgi:4-hydroxy-3-methylbut-2-enyl diphosphate reductase